MRLLEQPTRSVSEHHDSVFRLLDAPIVYSAVATYPVPESEKECKLREAKKLPRLFFSFTVERRGIAK